jgi:hypothetical protein
MRTGLAAAFLDCYGRPVLVAPGISLIDGSPDFGRAAFGVLMPGREKGAQAYRRVSAATGRPYRPDHAEPAQRQDRVVPVSRR